jgi:hypothetical protein
LVLCAPIWAKFGKILTLVPPKSVAEIQLRAFDRFKINFSHFGRKQNNCVELAGNKTEKTLVFH